MDNGEDENTKDRSNEDITEGDSAAGRQRRIVILFSQPISQNYFGCVHIFESFRDFYSKQFSKREL